MYSFGGEKGKVSHCGRRGSFLKFHVFPLPLPTPIGFSSLWKYLPFLPWPHFDPSGLGVASVFLDPDAPRSPPGGCSGCPLGLPR